MLKFQTYIPQTPALREFLSTEKVTGDLEAAVDKLIQEDISAAETQDTYKLIKPIAEIADYKRDLKYIFKAFEVKTQLALEEIKERGNA